MTPDPIIVIPRITKPTSGLVYSRYSWKAEYMVDGKRRQHSLGINDRANVADAVRLRDKLHRALLAQGALRACSPEAADIRRHGISPKDPKRFIHKVRVKLPFKVVIDKRPVGRFATLGEAMVARNAELGIGGAA